MGCVAELSAAAALHRQVPPRSPCQVEAELHSRNNNHLDLLHTDVSSDGLAQSQQMLVAVSLLEGIPTETCQ